MFGWLLLHVIIGAFYRPIRQGRKVAYLTLVSFVFLVAPGRHVRQPQARRRGGGKRGENFESRIRTSQHCRRGDSGPCTGGARMNVQVVGCSHHGTSIGIRERLAFGRQQAEEALHSGGVSFHDVEGVLLSTCNRVEIYAASQSAPIPGVEEIGRLPRPLPPARSGRDRAAPVRQHR